MQEGYILQAYSCFETFGLLYFKNISHYYLTAKYCNYSTILKETQIEVEDMNPWKEVLAYRFD